MTSWALQGQGPMASRARQVLSARQAQSGQRIRGHITDELGPTVDPIAGVEDIRRRVATASEPGYNAAYAQPMVITDRIASIMQTPAFRNAVPNAVENIRNAERDPQALGFRLHDDGSIMGGESLSTEGFDQVLRAMQDNARGAMDTSGMFPRNTTNSVHINNRARDLRTEIGNHNEPYRDVTANYADEMALIDGMSNGQNIGKLSGSEIEALRRQMPQHAQEAFMAGGRTALADTATQTSLKPTANVAQRVRQQMGFSGAGSNAALGDQAKLQAIETMSGRPGVMNRMDDRLEGEDQAFKTFAETYGNSKTQPRQALDDALSGDALQTAGHVATGNIAGLVSSLLFHGNPKGTLRFKRDVQDRIAQVMTETQPQSVHDLLAQVADRAQRDQAFNASLSRAGINIAKIASLQAASQDTAPLSEDDDGDQDGSNYPPSP